MTVFSGILILAALTASTPSEEIREAAEQVLAEPEYQTEIPVTPVPKKRSLPPWIFRVLGSIFALLTGNLLLVAVLVVLAAVLVFVARAAIRRGFSRKRDPKEDDAQAGGEFPFDGPLPDPGELARSGRFAEAIHALLLSAQQEIGRRRHTEIPCALTSREVLRWARLTPAAERELGSLVLLVDQAVFAGEDVGPPDYERGRGHLSRFRSAQEGGAG